MKQVREKLRTRFEDGKISQRFSRPPLVSVVHCFKGSLGAQCVSSEEGMYSVRLTLVVVEVQKRNHKKKVNNHRVTTLGQYIALYLNMYMSLLVYRLVHAPVMMTYARKLGSTPRQREFFRCMRSFSLV